MKTILLLLAFSVTVVSLKAQTDAFPMVEQYKLSNGLKVYLIPYGNISATAISLFVNCGKRNETPGRQYLSQLAASCVNFGNEKYNLTALDNTLFRLGSDITASARDHYTEVSSIFLNEHIDEGFDVFSNAVLHPTFPEKEIKQLLSETIDFNNASKVDIGQQTSIFSRYWIYGTSNPMGRYFYKSQLEKITPAAIKEFYEFNYTPANARLVVCGKIDNDKIKALIQKYFGGWTAPYGENNGAAFENPLIKKKEYGFINRDNATQAALRWTKNGPDVKSKDVPAFLVANSAFSIVLMKEVREKGGKTYGISSAYNEYSMTNFFSITSQVRNEEMLNTVKLVDKALTDFNTKGISEKQLAGIKKQMRNQWLAIENPRDVITFFNPIVFPKPELRKNYLVEIDALTLSDVNKVIKKYYTPDVYKLMIAGSQVQLNDQLKQLPALKIFNAKDIETDL